MSPPDSFCNARKNTMCRGVDINLMKICMPQKLNITQIILDCCLSEDSRLFDAGITQLGRGHEQRLGLLVASQEVILVAGAEQKAAYGETEQLIKFCTARIESYEWWGVASVAGPMDAMMHSIVGKGLERLVDFCVNPAVPPELRRLRQDIMRQRNLLMMVNKALHITMESGERDTGLHELKRKCCLLLQAFVAGNEANQMHVFAPRDFLPTGRWPGAGFLLDHDYASSHFGVAVKTLAAVFAGNRRICKAIPEDMIWAVANAIDVDLGGGQRGADEGRRDGVGAGSGRGQKKQGKRSSSARVSTCASHMSFFETIVFLRRPIARNQTVVLKALTDPRFAHVMALYTGDAAFQREFLPMFRAAGGRRATRRRANSHGIAGPSDGPAASAEPAEQRFPEPVLAAEADKGGEEEKDVGATMRFPEPTASGKSVENEVRFPAPQALGGEEKKVESGDAAGAAAAEEEEEEESGLVERLDYHVELMRVLSAVTKGKVGVAEAKVQSMVPLADVARVLGHPESPFFVRSVYLHVLEEVYFMTSLQVRGLATNPVLWDMLRQLNADLKEWYAVQGRRQLDTVAVEVDDEEYESDESDSEGGGASAHASAASAASQGHGARGEGEPMRVTVNPLAAAAEDYESKLTDRVGGAPLSEELEAEYDEFIRVTLQTIGTFAYVPHRVRVVVRGRVRGRMCGNMWKQHPYYLRALVCVCVFTYLSFCTFSSGRYCGTAGTRCGTSMAPCIFTRKLW